MRLAWLVWSAMAVAQVACRGGGAQLPPSDIADAGPRPPGDADVPVLGDVCLDGWCFENPRPGGPIRDLWVAGPDDVWLAAPGALMHYDGHSLRVETGVSAGFSFFDGTAADDLWARGGGLLQHYDGSRWAYSQGSPFVEALDAVARDDVWAIRNRSDGVPQLWHFDGQTWAEQRLPDELLGDAGHFVVLDTISAIGAHDLWLTARSLADSGITPWLARFDGHTWSIGDLVVETGDTLTRDMPISTLRRFAADDAWIGNVAAAWHWNGVSWRRFDVAADRLVGTASDDLWATSGASAAHWDGFSFISVGDLDDGPARFAAGVRDQLWALGEAGTPYFSDGQGWHALGATTLDGDLVQVLGVARAGGGQDLWVRGTRSRLGDYVARRGGDGRWRVDDTLVGAAVGDLHGLYARAADDLWAFGYQTFHFDGDLWRRTALVPGGVDPLVYEVCASSPDDAYAASFRGVYHWDGGAWTAVPGASIGSLRCLDAGDVWMLSNSRLEHREGDRWRASVAAPSWLALATIAPHELWTVDGDKGVVRRSGGEWLRDDLHGPGLSAGATPWFEDVSGRSGDDVFFLVRQQGSLDAIVHHDGVVFDRTLATPSARPLRWLRALARDDLLVVDQRFGTYRLSGGTTTVLAAGADGAGDPFVPGPGEGELWFASASAGWAIDGLGRMLRFDGLAWSVDASFPLGVASDFQAFAMDDVWVVGLTTGAAQVAHLSSTGWTSEPLPPSTIATPRIFGAAPDDLWIIHGNTVLRNTSGQFEELGLPPGEGASQYNRVDGSAADDVWIQGTYYDCATNRSAVYHFDGTSFTRDVTLESVFDLRLADGALLVLGSHDTCVAGQVTSTPIIWQHTAAGWHERPDLDASVMFPTPPAPPSYPAIVGPVSITGSGPWWAVGIDGVIVRHE